MADPNSNTWLSVVAQWSAIATPIVVAIFGWFATAALRGRELGREYVEMALRILNQDPGGNRALREWAVKILGKYSPVPLDTQSKKELISGDAKIPVSENLARVIIDCSKEDPKKNSLKISVTNIGKGDATNLRLEFTGSENLRFENASGPTNGQLNESGQIIRFDSLPLLAPRAIAYYSLNYTSVDGVPIRLRISMLHNELPNPQTMDFHIQ